MNVTSFSRQAPWLTPGLSKCQPVWWNHPELIFCCIQRCHKSEGKSVCSHDDHVIIGRLAVDCKTEEIAPKTLLINPLIVNISLHWDHTSNRSHFKASNSAAGVAGLTAISLTRAILELCSLSFAFSAPFIIYSHLSFLILFFPPPKTSLRSSPLLLLLKRNNFTKNTALIVKNDSWVTAEALENVIHTHSCRQELAFQRRKTYMRFTFTFIFLGSHQETLSWMFN